MAKGDLRFSTRRIADRRTTDRPDSPIFEDRSAARRAERAASAAKRVVTDRKDAERADDDGMALGR